MEEKDNGEDKTTLSTFDRAVRDAIHRAQSTPANLDTEQRFINAVLTCYTDIERDLANDGGGVIGVPSNAETVIRNRAQSVYRDIFPPMPEPPAYPRTQHQRGPNNQPQYPPNHQPQQWGRDPTRDNSSYR